MRLIDADTLAEGVNKYFCNVCSEPEIGKCKACEIAECLDMINDTPTIEAEPVDHGWISVKDKMPENYKPVLVYDQEWGIRIDTVSIEPFEEFAHYGYVTHWQPLPEPPERGDNDD